MLQVAMLKLKPTLSLKLLATQSKLGNEVRSTVAKSLETLGAWTFISAEHFEYSRLTGSRLNRTKIGGTLFQKNSINSGIKKCPTIR